MSADKQCCSSSRGLQGALESNSSHSRMGGGLQCGVWRSVELLRRAQSVWFAAQLKLHLRCFPSPCLFQFWMNGNKPTRGRKRLTDTGYKRRFASDNLMLRNKVCLLRGNQRRSWAYKLGDWIYDKIYTFTGFSYAKACIHFIFDMIRQVIKLLR